MRNIFFLVVSCTVCLFLLASQSVAATVKEANVKAALDSESIDFGSCTNASTEKSYSNDHIVNEYGKKTTVTPVMGSNFLLMNGQEGNSKVEERSRRIKSAFSFEVAGARMIEFWYRVATWGSNDDVLVFYEDDIDDTLFEEGGDCWEKTYTEDGEKNWDLEYTEFWKEGYIDLQPTTYFHTVNVALLAPYWDPEDDAWFNPKKDEWYSDYVVPYKAWLDCFAAKDSDYEVCEFSEEDGTSFGGKGMTVYLETDYGQIVDNNWKPSITFFYTMDGKTPTTSSTRYDDAVGIDITEDTTLRVAAYEGTRLISDAYSATYTRRPAPSAPTANAGVQEPYGTEMEIGFAAESANPFLEFHYTLDGTEPTTDSPKGHSCFVTAPCTLKVVGSDDGYLGVVSTFAVRRLPAPSAIVLSDGIASKNGVFDQQAKVSFQGTSDVIFCRMNDQAPQKYTSPFTFKVDGKVEAIACRTSVTKNIANGGECLMNSEPVCVAVRKSVAGDSAWLEKQLTQRPGWNLLAISKDISVAHGKEIAAWLEPVGFNAVTKAYEMADSVVSGLAYWVYVDDTELPTEKKPASFRYCERTEEVVPSSVWQLLSGKASFSFGKDSYRSVSPEENLPGWAREK